MKSDKLYIIYINIYHIFSYKSKKLQNRMDTIFIDSDNSETHDPHRLLH